MKKILLLATGSVAIIKLKKIYEKLTEHFNVKVMVSKIVINNYKNLNVPIEKEDNNLLSFPLHIKNAKWADLILVAPATTNTLSKFAAGIADNQILSTLIAARNPIIFVPAMNEYMYKSLVQRDIFNKIAKFNHMFLGPVKGALKENEYGWGRMVEPQEIVDVVLNYFKNNKKNILLVNGASKVYIDPIRYVSNDSSGLMGQMLANQLRIKGHNVVVLKAYKYSNKELLRLIKKIDFDTYISPAALADFDCKTLKTKIKKSQSINIKLFKNIDILEEISKMNKEIIAFKLDNKKQNAIDKLNKLNAKFIVWNKIGSMGNKKVEGEIIFQDKSIAFKNIPKLELAKKIAEEI